MSSNIPAGNGGLPPGYTQAAGPPASDAGSPPGSPDWGEFVSAIDRMGDQLGSRLEREIGGRLDQVRGTVEQGFAAPAEAAPQEDTFDFDVATNRQMYDMMLDRFQQIIDLKMEETLSRVLTPYAQEITGLRRDLSTDQGQREIDRLQASNKDYVDWVPEMKEIAGRHPTMSLSEVYIQAKGSNPDKAKALDARYNPPPTPPPRPFSLGPGSPQGSDQGLRRMTKDEAAADAWRQVNERHGGVLGALEQAFPQGGGGFNLG